MRAHPYPQKLERNFPTVVMEGRPIPSLRQNTTDNASIHPFRISGMMSLASLLPPFFLHGPEPSGAHQRRYAQSAAQQTGGRKTIQHTGIACGLHHSRFVALRRFLHPTSQRHSIAARDRVASQLHDRCSQGSDRCQPGPALFF